MTSTIAFATLLLVSTTSGLTDMFDSTTKDFGNVPYGSINLHRFVLKNTSNQTIRCNSARSSCHCATPKILSETAGPGEELVIEVKYDAGKFTGQRSMTISVQFAEPTYETVTLRVTGNSRQDIVLRPSLIDFGVVPQGTAPTQSVVIEYRGSRDFKIEGVSSGKFATAKLVERPRETGLISYELTATLSPLTPPGAFEGAITLKSNDTTSPVVTVLANALVEAPLSASPNALQFGSIAAGQKLVKKVLLKGEKPFTIKWVKGQDEKVLQVYCTQGERRVHLLSVEFAPTAAGKVDQVLEVQTSLVADKPLPIHLTADVGK